LVTARKTAPQQLGSSAGLRVFRFGAFHVLRGLRIETDDIARLYELGHQDFDAIVELGRLEGIILL